MYPKVMPNVMPKVPKGVGWVILEILKSTYGTFNFIKCGQPWLNHFFLKVPFFFEK